MDHNSIIRHYEIVATNGQKKNTYISLVRNITIGSLQPSSMYIISVAAYTIGRGPLSDPVTITMPEDGKIMITIIYCFCYHLFYSTKWRTTVIDGCISNSN